MLARKGRRLLPRTVHILGELRQVCRNLVTVTPLRQVPMITPEAEPQGNAMSVRITAAGAVAVAFLSFLTAPVSACDERYIKKCERTSAAAAVAAADQPAATRKSAGRVHVIVSRRARQLRFAKRLRAPGFARRERGMVLASAESRMATLAPESPLARRFRGFIDPQPLAQNAFEALRKPHLAAVNLEPPLASAADTAPVAAAERQAEPQAPAPAVTTAKQDRVAPKPAMELASAESKPVMLAPAPVKPALIASANAASSVPQAFVSEAPPPAPDQAPPSRFSIHQLVIALCGALGAAGALRFIVGA
jgi:hypothetical protein